MKSFMLFFLWPKDLTYWIILTLWSGIYVLNHNWRIVVHSCPRIYRQQVHVQQNIKLIWSAIYLWHPHLWNELQRNQLFLDIILFVQVNQWDRLANNLEVTLCQMYGVWMWISDTDKAMTLEWHYVRHTLYVIPFLRNDAMFLTVPLGKYPSSMKHFTVSWEIQRHVLKSGKRKLIVNPEIVLTTHYALAERPGRCSPLNPWLNQITKLHYYLFFYILIPV